MVQLKKGSYESDLPSTSEKCDTLKERTLRPSEAISTSLGTLSHSVNSRSTADFDALVPPSLFPPFESELVQPVNANNDNKTISRQQVLKEAFFNSNEQSLPTNFG
mgnify:CR=1 FL=1